MTYRRVIPRDLFNEASLLKCLGHISILTEPWENVSIVHTGSAFNILQDPRDGSIRCGNICLIISGVAYDHSRPLNSREPWPLWIRPHMDPDADDIAVFDDDGTLSSEMRELLGP
jgi:hypothetical protein